MDPFEAGSGRWFRHDIDGNFNNYGLRRNIDRNYWSRHDMDNFDIYGPMPMHPDDLRIDRHFERFPPPWEERYVDPHYRPECFNPFIYGSSHERDRTNFSRPLGRDNSRSRQSRGRFNQRGHAVRNHANDSRAKSSKEETGQLQNDNIVSQSDDNKSSQQESEDKDVTSSDAVDSSSTVVNANDCAQITLEETPMPQNTFEESSMPQNTLEETLPLQNTSEETPTTCVIEDEGEQEAESDESDEDEDEITKAINRLPPQHTRGLMSTLIGLAGPEIQNKKPEPLPTPQPLKFQDDHEKFLSTPKRVSTVSEATLLENGITPQMLEEASMEVHDEHEFLPDDIGRETDKPEFYCKLCDKQTTSIGNFRDHLNGKSHKAMIEAVKSGKKLPKAKKKTEKSLSEIGKTSVCLDIVKNAKEPILGLSFVTEYHSTTGVVCVCNLCAVKFDYNVVVSHVTGSKHRLRYMKEKKPTVYIHLKKFGGKKSQLTQFLAELCLEAEKEDGAGKPTIKVYQPEKKKIDDKTKAKDFRHSLVNHGQMKEHVGEDHESLDFQDWINQAVVKAKAEYDERKHSPSPSKSFGDHRHMEPSISERKVSQERHEVRKRSPSPRLSIVAHKSMGTARSGRLRSPNSSFDERPYTTPSLPIRSHRQHAYSAQESYSSINPRHLELYRNPLYRNDRFAADPLRRYISRPEQISNPDSHIRKNEPYLDPDPVRRLQTLGTPSISDSSKKVNKPMLIDYGHNRRKDDVQVSQTPAKSKAHEWEDDIKHILQKTDGQGALNSLALISHSYSSSSPKQCESPKKLPFSSSYLEKLEKRQAASKLRSENLSAAHQQRDDLYKPSSSHSRYTSPSPTKQSEPAKKLPFSSSYLEKLEKRQAPSKLRSEKLSTLYQQNDEPILSHSRNVTKSKAEIPSKYHHMDLDISDPESSSRSYSLKNKYLASSDRLQSELLQNQKSRGSKYGSLSNDHTEQRRSRSPKRLRSPRDTLSPVRSSKKPHLSDTVKEEQQTLTSDAEADVDRIANLLLEISNKLTGQEDPQTALKVLFSNADLTRALMATNDKMREGKAPDEKSCTVRSTAGSQSLERSSKFTSPEKSSQSTKYCNDPRKPEPLEKPIHQNMARSSTYLAATNSDYSGTSHAAKQPSRDKVAFSVSASSRGLGTVMRNRLPVNFANNSDDDS